MFLEQTRMDVFDGTPIRQYDSGACVVDARIVMTMRSVCFILMTGQISVFSGPSQ